MSQRELTGQEGTRHMLVQDVLGDRGGYNAGRQWGDGGGGGGEGCWVGR